MDSIMDTALGELRINRANAIATEARQSIASQSRTTRSGRLTGYRNGRPQIQLPGGTPFSIEAFSSGSPPSDVITITTPTASKANGHWMPRG